jgi:hypothetical protein
MESKVAASISGMFHSHPAGGSVLFCLNDAVKPRQSDSGLRCKTGATPGRLMGYNSLSKIYFSVFPDWNKV